MTTMQKLQRKKCQRPSRRTVIKGIGAGVAASTIAMPWVARAAGTIKVGVVAPATGPLAPFGATDAWTIDQVKKLLADGLDTAAGKYNVEILVRDGQSDPNRAAEVAGDLILNEEVHIIMPTSTTDMVSNTMDQAELNQCPCISSGAPWQAVIFPRGGAEKPFDWTYHFFWGLDEALRTFVGLWNTIETNRKVGMLFPQNPDGETWGNDSTACRCRRRRPVSRSSCRATSSRARTTTRRRSPRSSQATAISSAASPTSTTSRPS